jgi:hypothetical protein
LTLVLLSRLLPEPEEKPKKIAAEPEENPKKIELHLYVHAARDNTTVHVI